MLVRGTPWPPAGDAETVASCRRWGRSAATRASMAHTWLGGSSSEKVVVTVILCLRSGRLRLVNEAPASTEFGVICRPVLVSRCTARQFTSTTRPRAAGVSNQSPSWNGCSNSINNPEMIWPDGVLQRQADDDRRHAERSKIARARSRPR